MVLGQIQAGMARTVNGGSMNSPAAISEATLDAVHAVFNDVYVRLASATFEELTGDLHALLERYEAEYQAFPVAWLELRRRVAETTLTVAVAKRRPIDECRGLLAEIQILGWSDLHRRAQMEIMFCGYCARNGQLQSALEVAQPLMDTLRAESERTGEETWSNHLTACQDLLGRSG